MIIWKIILIYYTISLVIYRIRFKGKSPIEIIKELAGPEKEDEINELEFNISIIKFHEEYFWFEIAMYIITVTFLPFKLLKNFWRKSLGQF